MRSLRLLGLASLAVVLASGAAHAGDGSGIVLESYTGSRPAEASKVLSAVLDELAARGFRGGGDGVGRRFEAQVSRAPISEAGLPEGYAEQIEKGHRAWIQGKFDDAVGLLGPIVDAAHANTGAFARNPGLRERLLKALIALALSQHRRGDAAEARATLGELVRGFPEAQIQKGIYGPEAATLFEQVKKDLAAAPRGRLLVKLADEQAEVFINERLERRGTTVKELAPGAYRVLVQQGDQQSRAHGVVIEAGKEVTLTVDLGFDAAVRTTSSWAGFEFASAAERERSEAGHAAAFATSIGSGGVVVLGIDEVRGRPAIVGSLVNLVNGREIRRASLALEPPPGFTRMRALAAFLAGENATADIDVQIAGDPAVVAAVKAVQTGELRDRPSRRWGGWTWIAGAGALAGLGTGGALLVLDGTCPGGSTDPNCPNLYNTAAPGWIAVGGGAVLAAVTVYLIVTRPRQAASTAFVVPTGDGAMAGFATRF